MTRNPMDSYRLLMEIRKRMEELSKQKFSSVDYISEDLAEMPTWTPPFDIVETTEEVILFGELPGLEKDDLQIQLTGNNLQILGIRRPGDNPDAKTYHFAERMYGAFQRSFTLPESIAEDRISTSLKNGLLEIRLEKIQPRTIEIE